MSVGEIILYILLTLYLMYCFLICGGFCYYEILPDYVIDYIRARTYTIVNIELPNINLDVIEEEEDEGRAFN